MIVVHHLESSRSQRVLWLLEELGVDYEIRHYSRDPKTSLAPPELKAVHPLGKSPLVSEGDTVVAESGAIVEYLLDRFDDQGLRPEPDSEAFLQYRYWLHYAEGTLAPLLVMSLIFSRVETAPMPFFIKPIAKGISGKVKSAYLGPNLAANFDFIEQHLARYRWFAGATFSAADVMMSFGLEAASARAGRMADYPRMREALEAMHARPAYQRALERGGPYNLMQG